MRCFSNVRGDKVTWRAASDVRKYRCGSSAFESDILNNPFMVWRADETAGGSPETMEGDNLKEDGEDWGVDFRHPLTGAYFLREGLNKAR